MNLRLLFVLSSVCFAWDVSASQITCSVASAIDGKSQPTKNLMIDANTDPDRCAKAVKYIVPTTSVEVTVHGHFDCDPSNGFCAYTGPSVDGVEIHDKAAGNYSQSFGACVKASEFINTQFISQSKQRVNVVVNCSLHQTGPN